MKQSEKTLVGLMLIVAGAAIVGLVGLPQWDTFSNNQTQVTSLNDELKSLDAQKVSLTAEIGQLEKNSIIPKDVEVQVYTDKNREQIIKSMLDHVVGLATQQTGNLFISLAPSDESKNTPAPPPPPTKGAADTAQTAANAGGEPPVAPSPVLNKFSYELSVRGTYSSIQNFLKEMAKQKALMEIASMRLENEQGTTTVSADSPADPFHPIKMTATIRLALQPSQGN
jgi:hypothetical protein